MKRVNNLVQTSSVTNGNWHHLVLTQSANKSGSKLYFDRNLVSQISFGYIFYGYQNSDNFMIGGNGTFAIPCFNGKMDNFRLNNRSLSSSEIEEIYEAVQ